MKKLFGFAFFLLASFSASAVSESNKTILSMGAQTYEDGGIVAYVNVSPPPAVNCTFGMLYIPNLSSAGGTVLYSMLQKAYSLGKPLARVDYSQDSNGLCLISLIELGR